MMYHIDYEFTAKLLVAVVAGIVCLFTLYAVLLETAPSGHEDTDGFHYDEYDK